jgi:hypothetical protein
MLSLKVNISHTLVHTEDDKEVSHLVVKLWTVVVLMNQIKAEGLLIINTLIEPLKIH